jgi:hypothetical protein
MPQVSDFTLPLWRGAVQEYKQLMEPVEHQISQKLRELISKQPNCMLHVKQHME